MSDLALIPIRHDLRETAKIIGCSDKSAYRAIESGGLAHYRIAGKIFCSDGHIAEYIRRCERPAKIAA